MTCLDSLSTTGLNVYGYVRGVKERSGKAWWGRFLLWCSDLSHKWFMHDRMLWLPGEQRKVIGPVNNGSNTSKWWGCAPLTRIGKLQERRGGVWDRLAVRCDWTCSATDLLASQAHKHTVSVYTENRDDHGISFAWDKGIECFMWLSGSIGTFVLFFSGHFLRLLMNDCTTKMTLSAAHVA